MLELLDIIGYSAEVHRSVHRSILQRQLAILYYNRYFYFKRYYERYSRVHRLVDIAMCPSPVSL